MNVSIDLNPKHESYTITAFFEMLAVSGHRIKLTFTHDDLVNPDEPVSLENLGVKGYLLRLVNEVVFVDKRGKKKELHTR